MRYQTSAIVLLVFVSHVQAQDIANPNPAVQTQIRKVYDALQKATVDPRSDIDVCREVVALRTSASAEDIVMQVAVFAATTKSVEDTHVMAAQPILQLLDLEPRTVITVLAPYLESDSNQLREVARLWFDAHDMADSAPIGSPPIKPVNYEDYLEYVEWNVTRKHDIPPAFTKYIYDRAPGRALLVYAYANSHGDVTTRLQAIWASVEGNEPETKEQQEQIEKGRELQTKESREARLKQRRDIEFSEHVVSNAIWLNKNKFDERFQAALPEAITELERLAKHKEWWARLYVVYTMRQNLVLRQDHILRQLAEDDNELVREAAKSGAK
jgi:hypothetical protein